MPIIQNWDFQPGKKTNTTKDERKRNYPATRKPRPEPTPKLRNFPEHHLLMIKESFKFFRKLMNQGDTKLIQEVFKEDSSKFFEDSDFIFNLIYENIQILRKSQFSTTPTTYSKVDFWEEKPQPQPTDVSHFNGFEEKTLIQKLKSMNKSQRLDYWRNNSK